MSTTYTRPNGKSLTARAMHRCRNPKTNGALHISLKSLMGLLRLVDSLSPINSRNFSLNVG